jgi:hypothetical protein
MLTLTNIFDREYAKKDKREWEQIYVAIDFHDTILPASYSEHDSIDTMYTFAKEALSLMSMRKDCKLILWTSSDEEYIGKHISDMSIAGINFDYINENPECIDTKTGCFDDKFYFNVLLDDKAGFDGHNDWKEICQYFNSKGI